MLGVGHNPSTSSTRSPRRIIKMSSLALCLFLLLDTTTAGRLHLVTSQRAGVLDQWGETLWVKPSMVDDAMEKMTEFSQEVRSDLRQMSTDLRHALQA